MPLHLTRLCLAQATIMQNTDVAVNTALSSLRAARSTPEIEAALASIHALLAAAHTIGREGESQLLPASPPRCIQCLTLLACTRPHCSYARPVSNICACRGSHSSSCPPKCMDASPGCPPGRHLGNARQSTRHCHAPPAITGCWPAFLGCSRRRGWGWGWCWGWCSNICRCCSVNQSDNSNPSGSFVIIFNRLITRTH